MHLENIIHIRIPMRIAIEYHHSFLKSICQDFFNADERCDEIGTL